MCTDIRIVVGGHSFVSHLKNFLDTDEDLLNRYNYSFNLYRENPETKFIFRSGCDVKFLKNVLRIPIMKNRPHIIIIEIGSNDLTKIYIDPSKLASEVLTFCQWLLNNSTKFVIVSAVIYRSKSKMIPLDEYNARVDEYNYRLSELCNSSPNIIFWSHPRIQRGMNLLRSDGIHLNNSGNYHFYMSLKNALAHAIGHINRMEGCFCGKAYKARHPKFHTIGAR